MANPMTVSQFASLGGKARWKGIPKARRSRELKRVRNGRKKPRRKAPKNSP